MSRHRLVAAVAVLFAAAACGSSSPHTAGTTTRPTPPCTSSSTTSISSSTSTSTSVAPTSTSAPTTTTVCPPTTTRPHVTTTVTTRPHVTTTATTRPATTTTGAVVPAVQIRRGRTDRKRVAFTFDAGSDAGSTQAILDMLAAHHITATFGMTGNWARAYPAMLRSIDAAGHQLVDHTDHHKSFTGVSTKTPPLTYAQRKAEVDGGEYAIVATTGHGTHGWFRPPYGDTNAGVDHDVGAFGYRYDLLWTVDSLGWKGTPAATVAQRCLDGAGNGVIYLFHVGSASTDAAALPAIIDGLLARGYTITSAAAVL